MKTYELVVPCHFGLEAVLKREIYDLGYEIGRVEDGRITFTGDEEAICRANIFLRTAERVLIQVGRFHAETFEELFQGIKALPWENYIPENGKFWVKKASSIKSKLFSPSDIQSIAKKAMVERLKQQYHKDPEKACYSRTTPTMASWAIFPVFRKRRSSIRQPLISASISNPKRAMPSWE